MKSKRTVYKNKNIGGYNFLINRKSSDPRNKKNRKKPMSHARSIWHF